LRSEAIFVLLKDQFHSPPVIQFLGRTRLHRTSHNFRQANRQSSQVICDWKNLVLAQSQKLTEGGGSGSQDWIVGVAEEERAIPDEERDEDELARLAQVRCGRKPRKKQR